MPGHETALPEKDDKLHVQVELTRKVSDNNDNWWHKGGGNGSQTKNKKEGKMSSPAEVQGDPEPLAPLQFPPKRPGHLRATI